MFFHIFILRSGSWLTAVVGQDLDAQDSGLRVMVELKDAERGLFVCLS